MMENRELIFETRKLSKNFGITRALNEVNFKVCRGEITGLIGENGSGKSTITSIAAGMQGATSGEMFFKGKSYKPSSMIEGTRSGVGMIVQEQGTVLGRTIAQNIFLGEEKNFSKGIVIQKEKMNQEAKKAMNEIGLKDMNPTMLIDQLNMQDRKLIEIAKVIYNKPEMLIVDETTTALSQQGREIIYEIMRKMKKENKAVVFISHDLQELINICDTLTVLRDGNFITTLGKEEMEEDAMKRHMVGREIKGSYYRNDYKKEEKKEVVIKTNNITTGNGMLINFSMEVHKGEILGIGGLSHCGMHELGKAIFGEEKILRGDVVHMKTGQKIKNARQARKLDMGYVSKDRDKEALVPAASIKDNILSAGTDKVSNRFGIMMPKAKKEYVDKQVKELSIKCASVNQNVQYLSGGNKQKVIFGKWVGRDCEILILDCPTRGVDIGVKASMYQLIYEMKKKGKSIVMISEELPELIGMSDRLMILKDGKCAGVFERNQALTENEIIEVMI